MVIYLLLTFFPNLLTTIRIFPLTIGILLLFLLDVLGVLVEVAEPEWVHFRNQPKPKLRRNILIKDQRYKSLLSKHSGSPALFNMFFIQSLSITNYDLHLLSHMHLSSLSGMELRASLWGQRASSFIIDEVENNSNLSQITILLTGCLAKTYLGYFSYSMDKELFLVTH